MCMWSLCVYGCRCICGQCGLIVHAVCVCLDDSVLCVYGSRCICGLCVWVLVYMLSVVWMKVSVVYSGMGERVYVVCVCIDVDVYVVLLCMWSVCVRMPVYMWSLCVWL